MQAHRRVNSNPPQMQQVNASGGGGGGFQQQQDFSSWQNPMAAAAAGRHPAAAAGPADAYNNFYYQGVQGYSPFSTGDIRDSIAAIWSRTRED